MWSRSSVCKAPFPTEARCFAFSARASNKYELLFWETLSSLFFFFFIFLYFLSGTDSGFVLFSTLKAVAKKERIIMSPLGVSPGVVWAKVLDVEILSISSVFASYISLGYCIEVCF